MSRLAEPQLSFADVEWRHQGVHLDPQLQGILTFLDDHASLIRASAPRLGARVEKTRYRPYWDYPFADLTRAHPHARQLNWDYRELRERINDGYNQGIDVLAAALVEQLRQQITEYCKLGDQVADQTRRRVINGEQVPAEEKVYSTLEPHTDLIQGGKVRKPLEFGPKVFLAESAPGLITDYPVLDGNPADTSQEQAWLERHQQIFHCAPIYMPLTAAFTAPKTWIRVRRRE